MGLLSSEMVVKELDSQSMVLKQQPTLWWMLGGGFILIALNDLRLGEFFFGGLFLLGAFVSLVTTHSIKIVLDKKNNSLVYTQRTLGRITRERSLALSDIRGVELEKIRRGEEDDHSSSAASYRVHLLISGEEALSLFPEPSTGDAPKKELMAQIGAFLDLKI